MLPMLIAVLALGLLAAAWSAGFFWSWSFTVMPGLGAAPAEAAIAAMRAANAGIRTPGFAFVFFGPALLAPIAAGLGFAAGFRTAALYALLAAALYLGGVILVTFLVNLPLNDALEAARPAAGEAQATWRSYAAPWTAWNHLRTAAATAAFLALLLAALRVARG
jgi:uncharacterized membrane protein